MADIVLKTDEGIELVLTPHPEVTIELGDITGPRGLQGETGMQGIQGEVGPTGPTGLQGETGANGTDGVDGVVQAIVAGTNITVDSTDPANPIVSASGGEGTSDHGVLTGLTDDDHTQYHNDTRGDARYYVKSAVDAYLADKGVKLSVPQFTVPVRAASGSGEVDDSRPWTSAATGATFAYRGTDGVLSVGTPTATDHATTKTYVDTADTASRDRANHTGTQAISTITGLQAALDANNGGMTAYTPTLTNITLGNGTLTARYKLVDGLVFFEVSILYGSTTAITTPDSTSDYTLRPRVSLPLQGRVNSWTAVQIGNTNSANLPGASRMFFDASGLSGYTSSLSPQWYNDSSFLDMGLDLNTPVIGAVGDRITWTGWYEKL